MAEMFEENDDRLPVFLINGFLEAGKTQFLKFTMDQAYFQTDGTTLLVVCEEGEAEYEDKFLAGNKTVAVYMEKPEEMTKETLAELGKQYNPERILIEWNGMWPQDQLELPDEWFLNQQITIIDTSTLDLYIQNLRPLMGTMLRNTELVICNRADGIPEEKLGNYYLSLKAMAQNAELVFEGKEGEIRGDFNIELPYDLKQDYIEIVPENYAIFYVDSMDRPQKYDGKTVEFTGQVLKPGKLAAGSFVLGRQVMTCCAADTQYMGLLCRYKGADSIRNEAWIRVKAEIRCENAPEYGAEGPVLYIRSAVLTGPIEEIATFS